MSFDWTAWADSERQAAELRTGSDDPEALVADERYGRVLDIIRAQRRARVQLEAAEREAVEMAQEAQR